MSSLSLLSLFFDFHNKIKSKNKFDIAENKILNYFCLTLRLVKL